MASKISKAQRDALCEANPCDEIAARYITLRRNGAKLIGSCPNCSKDLNSRTATRFEVHRDGWVCAGCQKAGDVISLVMLCEGVAFRKAIDILGGVAEVDPADAARRAAEREAKAQRDAADNAKHREAERAKVYKIWHRGIAAEGTSAEAYLRLRGVAGLPVDRRRLRCIEDMPFYASGAKNADVIARKPAMLAPIMRGGKFSGLHITHIDLAEPKGKARIVHEGAAMDARKVRGSKAGGHIELAGPADPTRLFLGEGIEKVGAVYVALGQRNARRPGDAFWTCVDLGNLGGKAAGAIRHPTLKTTGGRARNVPGPVPDMAAPGIEIPPSATELIILADSTSDRLETLCAVARAVARFSRPGLAILVAWPDRSDDFDDLLGYDGGAGAVLACIEDAAPFDPADIDALAGAPRDSAACAGETNGAGEAGDRSALPSSAASAAPPDLPGAARALAAAQPADYPIDAERDHGAAPFDYDYAPPADLDAYGASADFARAAPSGAAGDRQPSQAGGLSVKGRDRAEWQGPPREDVKAFDKWLAFFPQTDLGNVERYFHRFKGRLMYCPALGWLTWDGRRWSREGADQQAKIAEHRTVRAIQDEAASLVGDADDFVHTIKNEGKDNELKLMFSDMLAAWGRASESASRLNPISTRAASYLTAEVAQLDADKFMITINNGTLVLRRKGWAGVDLPEGWQVVNEFIRLKPHDPDDLITKLAPVTYDPAAACPVYDAFLLDVQPGGEVRSFLDVWSGYSLTGDATEQRLVFHYGTGKNGKSTQQAVRLAIAGDYGRSIPIETFVNEGRSRAAGQASPDLAMLRGARCVVTSEPEKGWKLNEGLIKALTGGDAVPVRELNKPYFMLEPEFKLDMGGNYKPRIDGGEAESGIWRRVVLVPWAVRVAKDKRDMQLGAKLIAEASGILNRWLVGLATWVREGLQLPADIAAATEKFREDSDPLGRFLDDCTIAGGRAQATELYDLFVAWATANGEVGRNAWTPTGFGRAMSERGFEKLKSGVMYYVNITINKKVDDFVDRDGKPRTANPSNGSGDSTGGKPIKPDDVPV
jgi:putative DNA primase/helicase